MSTLLFTGAGAIFLVLPFLLLALILLGLRKVLVRTAWEPSVQQGFWQNTALVLLLWLAVSGVLAGSGFLGNFRALPPRMLLVLLPPVVGLMVVSRSRRFAELLQLVPSTWVIGLQSFRAVVEVGLWLLFLQGIIPVRMSFEGHNFDVLTGLTAPLAAWLLHRQAPRWLLVGWNVAGLALLLNIVVTALLSAPTPFRRFFDGPANTVIAQFPVVWLPAFLVPLAYWLHVMSLRQLLGNGLATTQPLGPAKPAVGALD